MRIPHRRPCSRTRLLVLAAATALATLGAGCNPTPTSMTAQWASATKPAPMRSVFVVGKSMDEATRMRLEDAFVNTLAPRGIAAKQSYLVISESPTDELVRAATTPTHYDGVLVATQKGIRTETTYQPAYYNGAMRPGVYGAGWNAAWSPGYLVSEQVVSVETTLWDTRRGAPVWSATTDTSDPSSDAAFVKSLTNEVGSALERAGMIPDER